MVCVQSVRRLHGVVTISLSDETVYRLPGVVYYDFRVRAGDVFDREGYNALIEEHSLPYALQRVENLLGERDYTEKEMIDKLRQSAYPEKTIARIMQLLTERKYVSDERYAGQYAARKIASCGRGKIYAALRQKGVDSETIRQSMENLDEEEELQGAIEHARRLSLRKDFSDKKERQQALNAMLRKGYSYDVARQAMDRIQEGEDDDDYPYD